MLGTAINGNASMGQAEEPSYHNSLSDNRSYIKQAFLRMLVAAFHVGHYSLIWVSFLFHV